MALQSQARLARGILLSTKLNVIASCCKSCAALHCMRPPDRIQVSRDPKPLQKTRPLPPTHGSGIESFLVCMRMAPWQHLALILSTHSAGLAPGGLGVGDGSCQEGRLCFRL